MNHSKLEDMVGGWFVGNFKPCAYRTSECEVAVKHYGIGDKEQMHYHRVATEITLIVSGEVRMLGNIWGAGDIVTISPGEKTSFEALTDAITVVVKLPSVEGDKYTVARDAN